MTYQINSTPYFQRMLRTKKRDGQLPDLEEEYERMNIFNERKLNMKMRNVHLNRLFKKIEEIKKSNFKKIRRLDEKEIPKSKETERLENLKNARKLGQYFSQSNMKLPLRKPHKLDRVKSQSLVSKRIEYGNKISNRNLHYIRKMNHRKQFLAIGINADIDNKKINNNSSFYIKKNIDISSNNSKNNNTNNCVNLLIDGNSNAKTSVLTLSENIHLINLKPIDDNVNLKTCSKIPEVMNIDDNFNTNKAAERWYKLAILTKANFEKHRSSKTCDQTSDKILISNKQISSSIVTALSETDIKSRNRNERLNNSEYIFDTFSTTLPSKSNILFKPIMKAQDDVYCHPFRMNVEEFNVGIIRQRFENYK